MSDSDQTTSRPLFPGYTDWEYTHFCCTNRAVLTRPTNVIFLGHWEISLFMPIIVCALISSSYLVAMLLIFPSHRWGIPASVILSVLFFLFLSSYARTIIDGPGYFPFYYPLRHSDDSVNGDSSSLLHEDNLSPSGIASTPEQIEWVAIRPKPNRCIFSKIARRIVIRPDHFCGWTTSWIGKRNHKFFLLFNFWGFFYIGVFAFCDLLAIIATVNKPSGILVLLMIYGFAGLMFGSMTASFICSHGEGLFKNVTSWEIWNRIPSNRFDRGCLKNIEDVFGSRKIWYCYLCPISPWTIETNEDLIEEYPPYREGGGDRAAFDEIE
jgi:hypothetical protein